MSLHDPDVAERHPRAHRQLSEIGVEDDAVRTVAYGQPLRPSEFLHRPRNLAHGESGLVLPSLQVDDAVRSPIEAYSDAGCRIVLPFEAHEPAGAESGQVQAVVSDL